MRTGTFVVALSLLAAGTVAAQPASTADPIAQAMRRSWDSAKRNIQESATQMPEESYGYKPVDTVRTFGQILAHVAGVNYLYCGAATGDKTPRTEDAIEKSATTKADIVKALDASLAYCDTAFGALTDAKAAEMVDMPFGGGKGARAVPLLGNIVHLNEHYGNLVTYFRMKGMVPPSSRR